MSPMNSRRTGCVSPAGKMSTMPPRTANSPCSSAGIFTGESGVDEQLGEIGRRDVLAGSQIERGGEHPFGRRDARQQRGRRRDEDPWPCRGRLNGARARGPTSRPRAAPSRDRGRLRAKETAAPPVPWRPASALRARPERTTRRRRPPRDRRRRGARTARPRGAAPARPPPRTALSPSRSGPRRARAGTSIPLRVMAVFRTARRLSEVEVATADQSLERSACRCRARRPKTFQCTRCQRKSFQLT